jgi:DNA-binding GntR family transcriptional regulator
LDFVGTDTAETSLVDRFRRDIVDGVYNPRERLVEAELATRYGVNRSAMRAALLELTSEGLVEREPKRGARVRALTVEDGIEIAQVRRELESLCARLAAERATDEEREQLGEIVAELCDAYTSRDMSRYLHDNAVFHTTIHNMARHQVARDILTRLGNLNFNLHFPMAFNAPVPAASNEEHRQIAEAIVRGDGDAAAGAMYAHLENTIVALEALGAPGQRPAAAAGFAA